jgi:valyl-tRNA synthetase
MRSEKMLANENFINRAKPEKVAQEKEKYQKYKEELEKYLK